MVHFQIKKTGIVKIPALLLRHKISCLSCISNLMISDQDNITCIIWSAVIKITNYKHQISIKLQIRNSNIKTQIINRYLFRISILKIGAYLILEYCFLVLKNNLAFTYTFLNPLILLVFYSMQF